MTEEQLVKALRRGELSALEALMDRYTPYVSSIASRILPGRPADAEELTADVFLAAWDNRDKLRPGQVKGWLGAVARNRAFNLLRASRESLPLEEDALLLETDGPDRALDKKETARIINQALSRLDKPQRELFVRHYYYGQTVREAALAVGCVLCIAAAGPLTQLYRMVSGDSVLIQTDPTGQYYLHISWKDINTPIMLEDGRLWLVLADERIDVTDLIDEDTPYILEGEDPDSGLKNYLIVGGTPEDYGWQIWMEMPLGGYSGGGWNTYTTYYDVDGELVEYHKWNAENHSTDGNPLPSELVPDTVIVNKPWYDAADAQLGLWD